LDTTTDHGSFGSLTAHELRVEVPGFFDQAVGLIQSLLCERSVHLLGTLEFCFLCAGQGRTRTTSQTSRKKLRSHSPNSTRGKTDCAAECVKASAYAACQITQTRTSSLQRIARRT
jgi:hypothetical protein